jgi:hypothetical protein
VALAGLAVTLVPINGPLLQRASVLHEHTIAQYFVPGYSGLVTQRHYNASIIRSDFGRLVNEFTAGKSTNIISSGCQGTCTGQVLGAGYKINCDEDTVSYNITHIMDGNNGILKQYSTMFYTNFDYIAQDNPDGNITFTTLFLAKNIGNAGFVNRTSCTLQPASILYPVKLVNDSVTLDPEGSWQTDRATQLRPGNSSKMMKGPDTYGGIALYLESAYGSKAVMTYDPIWGQGVTTEGSTVWVYVQNTDAMVDYTGKSEGITFLSPTFDMMAKVREVAFRAAVQMPTLNVTNYFEDNNSDQTAWEAAATQRVLIKQVRTETIYKTQYIFLIIAVLLTFSATFSVLAVFNGWWRLGRNVSLSPIEIARAFAAPALSDAGSNFEVRTLLKQVGDKELRYGTVMEKNGVDEGMASLRFGSAEELAQLQHGQMFDR